MFQALIFGLISCFLALAFWQLLRRVFFRTVLDDLPGPPPSSLWTGSLIDMHNRGAWDFRHKIIETYGNVIKLKGLFGANILYISDPKALHHILVKDYQDYEGSETTIQVNRLLFGEGIFTSIGDRHRAQRKMLNPAFSTAHLREMVPIFYDVGYRLRKSLMQKVENGPEEVDVLAWVTRCAMELIGTSGLGYSFDTLAENSVPHRYVGAVKQLLPLAMDLSLLHKVLMPFLSVGTARFRRAIVDLIPSEKIKRIRDVIDVIHSTSVEIIENKKHALREGGQAPAAQIGQGKDVISILMRENMEASQEDKLSDAELLGQVSSLTFAATDTTSGALSRVFHLLALHKDAQAKLRKEILEAKEENGGEDLSHDKLVALPYLDAICRETLRLHPPVLSVHRSARRDIVLPLGVPIKGISGEEIDALPIPKGTEVLVSILECNRNPELWGPDAHEWKPERWLNPLPDSLTNARIPGVYSHLLTFIGGGRSCIGFKFSQLEMKVVLVLLLEKLEFSLPDKNIVWQMSPVVMPSVDMDSTLPTLPMTLRLVD